MNPERILVIRTGGLGDTVLLWPAVSALRQRFPQAQIELMGHRERCQLLVVPGGADLALDIEGTGYHHLFEFSGTLPPEVHARFGTYDTILVFAAPGDYALAENLSACGVREVHAFLSFPPAGDDTHVASYAKQCLAGQGRAVDDPARESPLPVTDAELAEGQRYLQDAGIAADSLVMLAPGSGSGAKNWPPAGFSGLITELKRLDLHPVLIQGPADREAVAAVLAGRTGAPPAVLEPPAEALKGVLSRASLFVGSDSGPTQLAAAIGVPTVAVFGPTDPLRWGPQGPVVKVVYAGVSCSPCTPEIMHECDDRICLEQTTVSRVLAACRECLA